MKSSRSCCQDQEANKELGGGGLEEADGAQMSVGRRGSRYLFVLVCATAFSKASCVLPIPPTHKGQLRLWYDRNVSIIFVLLLCITTKRPCFFRQKTCPAHFQHTVYT